MPFRVPPAPPWLMAAALAWPFLAGLGAEPITPPAPPAPPAPAADVAEASAPSGPPFEESVLRRIIESAQERQQAREAEVAARFGLADHERETLLPPLLALVDSLPDPDPLAADRDAGARLALEQVALAAQARYLRPTLDRWDAWAERVGHPPRPGLARDPAGPREGAYASAIDGSPQPFRYSFPASRAAPGEPEPPVPLVVMLHGYVPSYDKEYWVDHDPATARAMDGLGAAFVWPFGRGNTDFLSIGEEDVLQAVEAMGRIRPIDRGRVYLAGYSMGGSGAWTLLAHYPGRWAGALIWSGRNDWFYWQEEALARGGMTREAFPAYKKGLVLADNPYDLSATLTDLRIHNVHPADDYMVKPGQATRMEALLAPPAGRMTVDQPATGGHFLFNRQMDDPATWADLLEGRLETGPDRVEHIAWTPRYGRKHWVAITELERWNEPARIRAEWKRAPGAALRVQVHAAENVRAFSLSLPFLDRPLVEFTDPAEGDLFENPYSAMGGESRAVAGEAITIRRKAALTDGADGTGASGTAKALLPGVPRGTGGATGTYGPVKEAFNQRFTLVLGTGGGEADQARNKASLERFARDWWAFAHAMLPQVTDAELLALLDRPKAAGTEAAWQEALCGTLVCFGAPATNAYLARVAGRLPFAFTENGYAVGPAGQTAEGQSVEGDELGLVACYPRPDVGPLGKAHPYVVIMDGTYYGQHLSFNHKWDLVPDYLVFEPGATSYDGTNVARLAGFFDTDWRFDPDLCWMFPPSPPMPTVDIPPRAGGMSANPGPAGEWVDPFATEP